MCRFHGARSGAPSGEANGAYRTGLHTKEAIERRRSLSRLLREARGAMAKINGADAIGVEVRSRCPEWQDEESTLRTRTKAIRHRR